jgi:hypothetical protein
MATMRDQQKLSSNNVLLFVSVWGLLSMCFGECKSLPWPPCRISRNKAATIFLVCACFGPVQYVSWGLQITAMATMSDQQRLEMLKEIGGTKIYEDRRRESLKTLHETDTRCGRINEMVCMPCGAFSSSRLLTFPNMSDWFCFI